MLGKRLQAANPVIMQTDSKRPRPYWMGSKIRFRIPGNFRRNDTGRNRAQKAQE
ncbi:hypothetical protein D3C75_738010 [compost metagenome]